MGKERIETDGKRVEIVDWGDNIKYIVELHRIKNPRDNLIRSVRRRLGDTHEHTYHEDGIPLLRARQIASGLAEHYGNITGQTELEYEVKVIPVNYFLALQG